MSLRVVNLQAQESQIQQKETLIITKVLKLVQLVHERNVSLQYEQTEALKNILQKLKFSGQESFKERLQSLGDNLKKDQNSLKIDGVIDIRDISP